MHNQFKTQKFKHLMLAMGPRDLHSAPYSPVHCSSHSMTSFQSSELTELPVVENSQLFAQRTVRPPIANSQGWFAGPQAFPIAQKNLHSVLPKAASPSLCCGILFLHQDYHAPNKNKKARNRIQSFGFRKWISSQ